MDIASDEGRSFVKTLFVQAAKFCFGHSMDKRQIEAFVDILHKVVTEDVNVWQRSAKDSFDYFQKLMLELSVDRPPRGIPLFTPLHATLGADFMLKTYFAQYKLYKYCLSAVPEPDLQQVDTAGIELPVACPPLVDAILVETLQSRQ